MGGRCTVPAERLAGVSALVRGMGERSTTAVGLRRGAVVSLLTFSGSGLDPISARLRGRTSTVRGDLGVGCLRAGCPCRVVTHGSRLVRRQRGGTGSCT